MDRQAYQGALARDHGTAGSASTAQVVSRTIAPCDVAFIIARATGTAMARPVVIASVHAQAFRQDLAPAWQIARSMIEQDPTIATIMEDS